MSSTGWVPSEPFGLPDNQNSSWLTSGMLSNFDPLVAEWFASRFDRPTEPQVDGWREIAAGHDVLITAPTGSGKTLAAFLICLDQLVREARRGELPAETR